MHILILEDEELAARPLQKIIHKILPDAVIHEALPTIVKAIEWLTSKVMPDIIFQDIQLADGNSFEIFKKVKITCPVIFTTAHDNYSLQAFKVNSVDYLLKPIDENDVKAAIDKLKLLQSNRDAVVDYREVLKNIQQPSATYRDHFVIKMGDSMKSINTNNIAYFYTENKYNFLCTHDGKRYPIDYNLDRVEQLLNPKNFSRINRQFVIGHYAIEEVVKENPKEAPALIKHLSQFYQKMAAYGQKDVILLEEELGLLRSYLFIQHKRYGDALKINIDIPPDIQQTTYIPPLVLQLLAENAVKHNTISYDRPLHLSIYIKDLMLVIDNNINTKFDKEEGEGLGLQNIKSRYRLFAKKEVRYGEKENRFIVQLPIIKSI
jgi:two-component system, LytTR family, response regulator LytT